MMSSSEQNSHPYLSQLQQQLQQQQQYQHQHQQQQQQQQQQGQQQQVNNSNRLGGGFGLVNNGVMMNAPLFAPATSSQLVQGGTEQLADLGDIFSDYFLHEFDDSTGLNAYNSMLAAAAAQAQQHQTVTHGNNYVSQQFMLPTGHGIMTPFHHGTAPYHHLLPAAAAHKFAVAAASATQQQQQQSLPQDALTEQYGHVAKKHKGGITLSGGLQQQYQQQQQQPVALAAPATIYNNYGPSSLSSRLGISITDQGQINMPHLDRGDAKPAAARTDEGASTGPILQPTKVNLPVGHGIRLGGGIATAANNSNTNNGSFTTLVLPQMTHTQWDTTSKTNTSIAATTKSGQQQQQIQLYDINELETGLTPKEVEDRRLRNREHAKRSRIRKKFILEALQQDVKELQVENQRLRMCVQGHIPTLSLQIITECCNSHQDVLLNATDNSHIDDQQQQHQLTQPDLTLVKTLTNGQQNFILSDPTLPDNPIVFASAGFLELTGYSREEVLGRNCRFLQGPGTDKQAVQIVRKSIESGSETCVVLLNYTADGTPFWNQLFLAPLRDTDGNIVNFIGVQCKVEPATDSGLLALEEKVNAVVPLKMKGDEDNSGDDDDDDDDDKNNK